MRPCLINYQLVSYEVSTGSVITKMVDLNDFNVVFGTNANQSLSRGDYESIRDNRRTLDNELFFDKLLKVLHVNGIFHPDLAPALLKVHQRLTTILQKPTRTSASSIGK